jgi:hypothetical protein
MKVLADKGKLHVNLIFEQQLLDSNTGTLLGWAITTRLFFGR